MGTRSTAKIKLRNAPYKCDICGRRLMSAEGLRSHQECVHIATAKVKTKSTSVKTAVTKPKHKTPKIRNVKLGKIVIGKPKTATPRKGTTTPKSAAKTPVKTPPKQTPNLIHIDGANVEYECPKCMKTFPIYFSAHRHIQKCHCVNSAGEKVLPNSPHIIKPLVKELCSRCKKQLVEDEIHLCDTIKEECEEFEPAAYNIYYVCAGCKQQFVSLKLFDLHVSGLHYDGVESMFFPSKEEFLDWKNEMEQWTKVRYSILGKYISKEMYRCTFLPEGSSAYDDSTSYVCPSTIVVQEFSKGVQVHFYKDHHGHGFENYVLSDKYKKYALTTLLQNADGYSQISDLKVDDNDLYLQFKKLMECIVLDSAKINVRTLKVLIGKALDMTSVLNSYDEDPDSDPMPTQRSVEENVTWEANNDTNLGGKRKTDSSEDKSKTETITKRFKTRMYHKPPASDVANADALSMLHDTTIKIINSYSLADKDISKAVNEMDSECDNNSQSKSWGDERSKDPTPILDENDSKDNLITPIKVKKKQTDKTSPSSFNDSYKDFVVKNFKVSVPAKSKSKSKTNASNSKKRPSKSVSPRLQDVPKESKTPPSTPPPEIKQRLSEAVLIRPVEYKYEVKEQENDCNILILKI